MNISVAYRVQLKRTGGWRMPKGAVKVDRSTKWGNPFVIGEPHPDDGRPISRDDAVALYRAALTGENNELSPRLERGCSLDNARRELRGRILACWCRPDQRCHADVLIELANAD